jgi:SNF2 family DNA or RNA helicase
LISLKAGGTGLNLVSADTVIHYDPWWNAAAQMQATDRAYRIGQKKPVFVYNLIALGSVEERMLALQARKRRLADNLLARETGPLTLSGAELESLFSPLAPADALG